jgi:hypothetical protein
MQLELLITMTPRLHVRSAPMSPKKWKQKDYWNLQEIMKD